VSEYTFYFLVRIYDSGRSKISKGETRLDLGRKSLKLNNFVHLLIISLGPKYTGQWRIFKGDPRPPSRCANPKYATGPKQREGGRQDRELCPRAL